MTDAVTLTGSSEYAVPGSDFTLTCDVPEEARLVKLFRRPDVSTRVSFIGVASRRCSGPLGLCTPNVCSCVTSTRSSGSVFRWVIQPQTGDHGSVWFCRRINNNLPDQILDSPDFTLNVADGPGATAALSPPDTAYTRNEGDTLPDITCTADCRPDCTFIWTKPDNTNFSASAVLSLGQLDRSENGTYRYTAGNEVGESFITTGVAVQYGPGTSTSLSPSVTSYTRTDGDTLPDITCITDCRPGCTIVWTKPDNTNLTASPVLSLGQLDRSEQGMYRCTAWNVIGTSSITTSVNVHYGPTTSIVMSPPDTTYTRTEGDTLPDITCTADCGPGCTFVWTKPDNTNFTVSPVLSLGQLDKTEHGTYRCTAWNAMGTSSITTCVNVQYGPGTSTSLSPSVTSYTRTDGDTLPDITCITDCRPGCTIVWTKPDNTNLTASPVLSLGQLDRSEQGMYRCTAWNVIGTSSITTSVNVHYGPTTSIVMSPPDTTYTRTEGDTLPDITCTADCGPGCTFVWTKPDNTNFTVSPVLSLGQLDKTEHGTYRCTAWNAMGTSSITTCVNVQYGPGTSTSLSPSVTSYTRTDGDTLPDITCITDCRPGCTIVWTKPDNTNLTASPVLSLGQLDRSEQGMYRCTAWNVIGTSNITTSVNVQYGPSTSIVMSPPDTTYTRTEGDTLPDITCIADCRPGCTFVWTKPENTNLTASPVLSLGQLDRSEQGMYRCTTWNVIGTSSITTSVNVQCGGSGNIHLLLS
ncbi:intercellular adhesion molecule 5-like [Mizuhopecten yessoensis]|uniref:intercellular adhesion molecule 5-like n=1 Tax=Mizuhopecten yessoensis TaxID=6573 RepID=UPI000B45AB96|nr:intercellular adhesion molecule 5-like [Mizuhopecten yessoensis]